MKKYSTVKERQEAQAATEARFLATLNGKKKQLGDEKREKQQKKKPVQTLLEYVDVSGIEWAAIKSPETYESRSYNLHKQQIGLLQHMFAKYKVPAFMYEFLTSDKPRPKPINDSKPRHQYVSDQSNSQHDTFKLWFLALAQGESLPKMTKGVFTKAEAAAFLSAPSSNSIEKNIWWARCKIVEIPNLVFETFYSGMLRHASALKDGSHPLIAESIRFIGRYHRDYDANALQEVVDFLDYKRRQEPTFSLKGRTSASVLELSNEWHMLVQKAKLGKNVSWPGLGLGEWHYDVNPNGNAAWTIVELLTNRELLNEGRRQKHCVYSYVNKCAEGRSAIFSLRPCTKHVKEYDEEGQPIFYYTERDGEHVTFEVNVFGRNIVQVRGKLNRQPTSNEQSLIARWANAKSIKYGSLM